MSLAAEQTIIVFYSSFVLGGQRFAADLLTLVVVLFGRFWIGLHVSAVKTEEREDRHSARSIAASSVFIHSLRVVR